ncbi:ATP-binding protein [Streptomyces sp. NPDC006475]|uniref:ATP-binding protein n=1 Tax=Streptomyces sp. NPDC006475 TaxID=3155719 RepID=UPI0033B29032
MAATATAPRRVDIETGPSARRFAPKAAHTLRLAHDATAAASARHAAETMLMAWRLAEESVYDTLLIITELVTNAVEHALPPVSMQLRLAVTDVLEVVIDVTDGGPAPEEGSWASSGTPDEHGRGEFIITALATHHGSRLDADGAHHWATVRAAR